MCTLKNFDKSNTPRSKSRIHPVPRSLLTLASFTTHASCPDMPTLLKSGVFHLQSLFCKAIMNILINIVHPWGCWRKWLIQYESFIFTGDYNPKVHKKSNYFLWRRKICVQWWKKKVKTWWLPEKKSDTKSIYFMISFLRNLESDKTNLWWWRSE